jgi:hypothetical protein
MKIYDRNKIGKLIAFGSDHYVFEYENNKVIKFSILFYLLGKKVFKKTKHDEDLCEKYFGKFLLKTELYISKNGKHLVQIQEKINGKGLEEKNLQNKIVKENFQEFINCYEKFKNETKLEIDLIGIKGIFLSNLSNIFLTEKNELLIIDATILHVEGYLKIIFYFLEKIISWRQKVVIEKFLK